MAKVSGIGATLTVEDNGGTPRDISNDVTSLSFGTPRGQQDVTGLDVAAMERILLRTDGTVSLSGVFNPAANKSHDVFKTVPLEAAVEREVVYTHPAGPVMTMTVIFTDYALSHGADGALTWQASGSLSNGVAPAWS